MRKQTHDEFIKKLYAVNSNIKVLGVYVDSKTPIQVFCRVCGRIWEPTPNNLLRGRGCSICSNKLQGLKRRMSDIEFKARMKEVNSNIEVLGTYVNSKTPIQVSCNVCGNVWKPVPSSLLFGSGCHVCSRKSVGLKLKKSDAEFKNQMKEIHTNINVLGIYINAKTPIQVSCSICGYVWEPVPYNLLQGKGCPVCHLKSQKKSDAEFKTQMKEVNSNISILGTYVNSKTPIQVSCSICGYVWESIPNMLLQGHGCPVCRHRLGGLKRRKSDVEFKVRMKEVNPNIEVLGTYTVSDEHIACKCKVCSYEWKPLPNTLLQGHGCPVCGGKQKLSDVEFKVRMEKINPDIEVLGTYINVITPIKVKCKICSQEWEPLPKTLLQGRGCSKCLSRCTSFVEQAILLTLKKLCPYEVIGRNRTLIGMELDVLIPAMHVAIEYGAWPWHKDKIERDQEKARLCEDKDILLIQAFDDYTGIESDTDRVWYYRKNIGEKKNLHIVKELIVRICERIGISFTLNDEEFDNILREARSNSRRYTTERFNKRLEEIGSKVRLLGDYQDTRTKILAECQECGYRWNVRPDGLIAGKGCPKCSDQRKEVICVESGIVYDSVSKAAKAINVNHGQISACCSGKRKTAGDLHWKYAEGAKAAGVECRVFLHK